MACFLYFSPQSHAESYGNYAEKLILYPNRTKLDEKSEFGYVQWLSRNSGPTQRLSRKTKPCQENKALSAGQAFTFSFLQKLRLSFSVNKFMSFSTCITLLNNLMTFNEHVPCYYTEL